MTEERISKCVREKLIQTELNIIHERPNTAVFKCSAFSAK